MKLNDGNLGKTMLVLKTFYNYLEFPVILDFFLEEKIEVRNFFF